mmetsp:Transcript_44210/g.71902  ORF Transcript_44210/g.71902 Transcript_44210/m.71902 type:complete len:263 (-) Transcript_44210:378-1166(-)
MQQPGKYRCGCGVLISNVGEAEREHFKSDRHQKWVKSQQTTKTLSAFFVKEQKPVGSSSSSSSITNTSNNYNTNSSSSNINCSSGGSNNNASSSSSSSGGAGEPFSPGRAPQPPPQMFIRVGGVWVGGLVLGGWVPQNPSPPLINDVCSRCRRYAHCCFVPLIDNRQAWAAVAAPQDPIPPGPVPAVYFLTGQYSTPPFIWGTQLATPLALLEAFCLLTVFHAIAVPRCLLWCGIQVLIVLQLSIAPTSRGIFFPQPRPERS